jgi:hypothetical protein
MYFYLCEKFLSFEKDITEVNDLVILCTILAFERKI